jgi:hypothetical protein
VHYVPQQFHYSTSSSCCPVPGYLESAMNVAPLPAVACSPSQHACESPGPIASWNSQIVMTLMLPCHSQKRAQGTTTEISLQQRNPSKCDNTQVYWTVPMLPCLWLHCNPTQSWNWPNTPAQSLSEPFPPDISPLPLTKWHEQADEAGW